MHRLAAVLLLSLGACHPAPSPAPGELSERWQAMNQPVEPFRIFGNLYYVGASSVTAFLITTPAGHILIDGGFEQTVPLIRSGIEKLGFGLEDVEILLSSHAHFDHAGGLARLRKLSGARFMASAGDAAALGRGGRGDPLLGDEAPFPPIRADRILHDGDVVELGGMRLVARITAGHTEGCTSWVFDVEQGGATYRAVSICSLSVLDGMRFHDRPTYAGIGADFERSFEVLESIPCDVFLASHAGFFRLTEKRARLDEGDETAFVDPEGYREYIERARRNYTAALEAQSEAEP